VIDGIITFVDVEKAYAVALSQDKKTEAIIHKACFDKFGQIFRATTTPQAVRFTPESRLCTDSRTGVSRWIASEVKLA
jgi:hypothetical protein